MSIESPSPGLIARFSDDGSKLITKGSGNVLKFKWDDNPKSAGKAVGELKVSDKTFRQKGEKGEERQTIFVGNTADGTPLMNLQGFIQLSLLDSILRIILLKFRVIIEQIKEMH